MAFHAIRAVAAFIPVYLFNYNDPIHAISLFSSDYCQGSHG